MKTEGLSEITQGTDLHRSTPVAGLACGITRLLGWWSQLGFAQKQTLKQGF